MGSQEAVRERFILPQETEQKVFGLNIRTAELARLVPREEDNAACFFGVTFKHKCHRQDGLRLVQLLRPLAIPLPRGYAERPSLTLKPGHSGPRDPDCGSRS